MLSKETELVLKSIRDKLNNLKKGTIFTLPILLENSLSPSIIKSYKKEDKKYIGESSINPYQRFNWNENNEIYFISHALADSLANEIEKILNLKNIFVVNIIMPEIKETDVVKIVLKKAD